MKNLFKDKKNRVILLLSVIGIIAIVIGVSYAFILFTATQQDLNKVSTDCINVDLVDDTDAITLNDAYPMSDDEGKNTKPYRFTLTNTCHVGVDYSVNLEVLTESQIESKDIGARLDGNNIKALNAYESKTPVSGEDFTATASYSLGTGTLKPGESKTHSVRIWLYKDAGNDTQNKHFDSKVIIEAVQNQLVDAYKEDILHGADPVLGDNLIPVRIADDGTVTKANIETEWYNYENQQWANAVILVDKGQEYNNYDVIPESNIESYFVWIPRYKYKIWDEGNYTARNEDESQLSSNVQSIEIQFETTNNAVSTGSAKESWLTHPAFTAFGVNGLWVGKFESGYKEADSTQAAEVNPKTEAEAIEAAKKLQIKPNVYSWRSIQLANAHLVSYNYQRVLDSHMMKNTEWGAVAYLTNSKYGRCKDNQCNEDSRVRVNNNASNLTGYAAKNNPTTGDIGSSTLETCSSYPNACNEYSTSEAGSDGEYTVNYFNNLSTLASTTGNYTGIYDISGGASEMMLAGMEAESNSNVPASGQKINSNSGFKGKTLDGKEVTDGIDLPESKYYDVYSYSTNAYDYNRGILGDATKELGPFNKIHYRITSTQEERNARTVSSWYKNTAFFPYSNDYSWFLRGGHYRSGFEAGPFYFGNIHGNVHNNITFRVVLAPR